MRADLHRVYIHPTTGLVARLTDIAKDFGISIGNARNRLIGKRPLIKVEKIKQPKKKKELGSEIIKKMSMLSPYHKLIKNPVSGKLEGLKTVARELGITEAAIRERIRRNKMITTRPYKKSGRLSKKRQEMQKLIAVIDARKAAINGAPQ